MANILLWFAIVLGVLTAVAVFGCLFLLVVEPFIQRRRFARAAHVAARFNRDNDTACSVLIGCETILYCTTRPLNYFDEAKKLDAEIARQAKKATKARVMANNENNGITEMTV
ncbi:hypothetical protein GCK72_024252 [Caenorhabditis remanei]|uniref:Uncharacterized protein n=1 Tax=Caenorhabditis remanei TaxID=31234 RepID=A0A6A5FYS0_CAERE|nr:hypothetical protein GCK72_024252 [Caenorhabditis remanei]KAF1747786.1 hypothetical protein GCK72_024252 [Caenorhabditis remanei]